MTKRVKKQPEQLDVVMCLDLTVLAPQVHDAFCDITGCPEDILRIELHKDGSILIHGANGAYVSIATNGRALMLDENNIVTELQPAKNPTHDEWESSEVH
jgi:hypothetical protein